MSLPIFFSRLTAIFLLIALPFLVWSQEQISGKVISQSDQSAIPGVSVFVKGTSNGTKTGSDGTYSIKASKGDIIVFSGIGMRQKEIVVGAQPFLDVALDVDPRALNEVVVIAMGFKKETKRIGYSVQEVKGTDLVKARESNPVNGLAGKISGLNDIGNLALEVRKCDERGSRAISLVGFARCQNAAAMTDCSGCNEHSLRAREPKGHLERFRTVPSE